MDTETNPHNMFRMSRYLGLVVASQHNIIVQPLNAEAHEDMNQCRLESQRVANSNGKPVTLLDRDGKREHFTPTPA